MYSAGCTTAAPALRFVQHRACGAFACPYPHRRICMCLSRTTGTTDKYYLTKQGAKVCPLGWRMVLTECECKAFNNYAFGPKWGKIEGEKLVRNQPNAGYSGSSLRVPYNHADHASGCFVWWLMHGPYWNTHPSADTYHPQDSLVCVPEQGTADLGHSTRTLGETS